MQLLALMNKFAVLVVTFIATTAEKSVKVRLRTTSCESSCQETHNDVCPSSISLNDREMSEQKDGFNILVLDSYTGIMRKRKHFKYFTDPAFWRKDKFKKFFQSLDNNSTIMITFQNMCKQSDPNWYKYLNSLQHTIKPSRRIHRQAIIVACKGTCPSSVPFTYQSNNIREKEHSMTLVFPGGRSPTDHGSRFKTYEPDIPAIACGVAAAIIIVTLIYACFLYYRQRTTPDENYYTSFQQQRGPQAPREDHKNPQDLTNNTLNEPIYEEICHSNIYNTNNPNNTTNRNESRDESKEQRYHVPEIERRSTTNSDTVRSNAGVVTCSGAGDSVGGTSPGGTVASAPPLSLYVSMDKISEHPYNNVPLASTTTNSHTEPTEHNSLL